MFYRAFQRCNKKSCTCYKKLLKLTVQTSMDKQYTKQKYNTSYLQYIRCINKHPLYKYK